ncbi:MAG TPA: molybdopterin cofactor-binding domain-containing protein [Pyrinomonadaceae bacterium]|nr:molybdopterin cofactor-binding domain-containing protein [Pyrinomonadaceae bacterium]
MKKEEKTENLISRRSFIASSIAGAFILALDVKGGEKIPPAAALEGRPNAALTETQLGTWLRIGADEKITIVVGSSEMGQGILTGLAQLVAEDLMVNWTNVVVEQARASSIYKNPLYNAQMTVGSGSMRGYYQTLRLAGATARDMLIAAAAQIWNVPVNICRASNGFVTNTSTNAMLSYGQLAAQAAQMPVPANPALVPDNALRYVGTALKRVDIPLKVDGSAIYGMDVRLPNMVYASVKHCPSFGGTLVGTPSTPSGAIAVVPLQVIAGTGRGTETTGMVNAFAVVADNTWKAMRMASQIQANWNIPASSQQLNSADFFAQAESFLANGAPDTRTAEVVGSIRKQMNRGKPITATYYLPYQAHAPMEVLNCTVRISGTAPSQRCEVWAPTQSQAATVATVAALTGLPASQIDLYTTFLGGGLGRKFEQDFISQAIQVAMAVNRPVKLMWSREEDFRRDQYRPMAVIQIEASLDEEKNIKSWNYRNCSPSIGLQRRPTSTTVDGQAVEGSTTATGLTYSFKTRVVKHLVLPVPIPVGYWRSVGNSINTFAAESMMDELAASANIDPYQFRRQHLANSPRALAVLDKAAANANWNGSVPLGRARGIALAQCFGSLVAQVVEISAPVAGQIRIHNIWCAVDCGRAVNPDSVKAQIEGGIVHGINAALWEQVKFTAGASSVSNFNNTRKIRLREMPQINIELMPTNPNAPLGGVGEPGVPAIAPAIANAYFKLTGNRVRQLPFFPQ